MNSKLFATIATGIIISFIILCGCTSVSVTDQQYPEPNQQRIVRTWGVNPDGSHSTVDWVDVHEGRMESVDFGIYKVTIPEDNVTCYVSKSYGGGGISCMKGDQP